MLYPYLNTEKVNVTQLPGKLSIYCARKALYFRRDCAVYVSILFNTQHKPGSVLDVLYILVPLTRCNVIYMRQFVYFYFIFPRNRVKVKSVLLAS